MKASDPQTAAPPLRRRWSLLPATGFVLLAVALGVRFYLMARADDLYLHGYRFEVSSTSPNLIPDSIPLLGAALKHPGVAEANPKDVAQFCGSCHALPPPSSLPRYVWHEKVLNGYEFMRLPDLAARYRIKVPYPISSVVNFYEHRAPEKLPVLEQAALSTPPVRFKKTAIPAPAVPAGPDQPPYAAVVNVNAAPLTRPDRPDILACDVRARAVMLLQPYQKSPTLQIIARGFPPAHTAVVDLDGDGIKDVLVANVGSFLPTDNKVGGVVWLKGSGHGSFSSITLLRGVGRVADVEAADFDGDGDKDLVMAVFGFLHVGEILYLENRTTDWKHPRFVPSRLDSRPGAIHVPVTDLNHDGRPDFIALITQDKEIVVAFLNQGNGRFQQQTIFHAPHPAYGCSGIQLLDFDRDGDTDVLLTNGDCLDPPLTQCPF